MNTNDAQIHAFAFAAGMLQRRNELRGVFAQAATNSGDNMTARFLTLLPLMKDEESHNRLVQNFYEKNIGSAQYITAIVASNMPETYLNELMEGMDEGVTNGRVDEGAYLGAVNALKILYELREEMKVAVASGQI